MAEGSRQRRGNTMPINLSNGPIDPQSSEYQNLLGNLQGNILKAHGRDHAVHLLLTFTAEAAVVRNWMRDFAERYVTSAQKQRQEADDFKTRRISTRPQGSLTTGNVMMALTSAGRLPRRTSAYPRLAAPGGG